MTAKRLITVFEHETLRADGERLTATQLHALQSFHGEQGVPYYSLVHNGVKFNEHVGVLQVGKTTIEVLPKADKTLSETSWRAMLVGMLRAVGVFDVHAPSSSSLRLQSNSILDLYFELFLNELEYLARRGLVKKYRKEEGNQKALKGSIRFANHIRENLVHKERFYVRYTTYDVHHRLHQVLLKALRLISRLNSNPILSSRIETLTLWLPEMADFTVTEATFRALALDRKTEPYRKALEIARLLLLNFHPDIARGRNDVLALMFNMNTLWERFVYVSLRKELQHLGTAATIKPQLPRDFWKSTGGPKARIRPDIVLNPNQPDCVVLDTKWKRLDRSRPADQDLQQMFVYHEMYQANRVALIYPGDFEQIEGRYHSPDGTASSRECSVIGIPVQPNIRQWQTEIARVVGEWAGDKL